MQHKESDVHEIQVVTSAEMAEMTVEGVEMAALVEMVALVEMTAEMVADKVRVGYSDVNCASM
tara:strand:- start:86 stop:274 length:189 start_codon:yes stop_codon:yes gene_type:complete